MPTQDQAEYRRNIPDDKGSNAVLRDITGASLKSGEISQLSTLFNDKPAEKQAPPNVINNDDLPLQSIIEQNLTELITVNGATDTDINLDEILEDPQSFIKDYLEKISPHDRQVFKEAVEDTSLSLEQQSAFEQETDEELPLDHNVIAFLAVAIGSGEASRIHRYLDDRNQRGTLAGRDDDDDEDSQRLSTARQIMAQMILSNTLRNINNQIALIDFRLDEIETRLGKIDKRLDAIGERLVSIEKETGTLEEKKVDIKKDIQGLEVQQKTLAENMETTKQNASQMQENIDKQNVGLTEAISALPIAKNGEPYAINVVGNPIYMSGIHQGMKVSENQRASWWAEFGLWGKKPSVEDILKMKTQISVDQSKKDGFDQKAAKIASRLKDVENKITYDDTKIEEIDDKLKKLGIETEGLTTEQTKLLLEKSDLTKEKRDLLEQRTGLVNERTKLKLTAEGLTEKQITLQQKSTQLETSITAMQAEVTRLEEAQKIAQENLDEAQDKVEITTEAALNAKNESGSATAEAEDSENNLMEDTDGNIVVAMIERPAYIPNDRFVNVNGTPQKLGFFENAWLGIQQKIGGGTTQENVDVAKKAADKAADNAKRTNDEAKAAVQDKQGKTRKLQATTAELERAKKEVSALEAKKELKPNAVQSAQDIANDTSRTGISAANADGQGMTSDRSLSNIYANNAGKQSAVFVPQTNQPTDQKLTDQPTEKLAMGQGM